MWSLKSVYKVLPILLLVYSTLAIPLPSFNETRADDDLPYRLPNNTRPVTYNIHLTTDVHRGERKFTGVVEVFFEILQPTSTVVLHARQLNITSSKLSLAWEQDFEFSHVRTYDERTEFLEVSVQGLMSVAQVYKLTLQYEGVLRLDGGGHHLQSYRNSAGQTVYLATTQFESTNARHGFPCYDEPQKKAIFTIKITHGKAYNAISNMPVLTMIDKYLATTQFQSTDARHAFPCYDEPDKKAVFKISITHHKSYNAISNMPVVGDIEDHLDGTVTTSFEPTTLISSYLVAWTVSDFSFTEKTDRIPHRIYSKPNFDSQHNFAMETSIAVLNSLNDYLEVDYPLPKMDNVAVPTKGGAMENWGMVTYGEQYLLYDEDETTTSSKTTIATIISHEFAHQWFGNLIGPRWWTYTWLNEGFASLYEFQTTDMVYPDWDIMQAFITGYFRNSLNNDARANPRPMTHYIESPAAIAGVFDYVSYGKSANVLRMIQHAFSEPTFRKALIYYQKEMKYQAAVEEDLFTAFKWAVLGDGILEDAASVDTMLKSWTNQGGYPLVTITRDYSQGTVTIKQEPFDGTDKVSPTDKRSWWIPYNFATANNPDFKDTKMKGHLMPGTASVTIQQGADTWSNDDWLIFNKQATSFYRVNYDEQNWQLIANALMKNYAQIHTHNRAEMLEDVYQLIRAKRLTYEPLLNLMAYLKFEDQYAPWVISNTIILNLDNYLSGDDKYNTFRFFYKKMVDGMYKRLGVEESENDPHLMKMLRGSIINLACRANIAECQDAANKKLRPFIMEGKKIESNLRTHILCTGMMNATDFEMGLMLTTLNQTTVQALRNQILSGLGCMRKSALLRSYLEVSLQSASYLSTNERLNILGYVVEKGAWGVKEAIDFLKEKNQDYLKISSNLAQTNPVVSAIRTISSRIFTEKQSAHYETLLEAVKGVEGVTALQLETVRTTVKNNLAWTEANQKTIISWTSKFYDDNDGAKEEEGEGDGDGGDGASTIAVSTSLLTVVSIVMLRNLI